MGRPSSTNPKETRPTFSPDGRRLAYAAERQGNWDLYVLDLETEEERRLTTHTAMDMTPSWSPR